MKAITLWQPWAQLYAMGAKEYETRSWFTQHLGELAIHAAKTDEPLRKLMLDIEFGHIDPDPFIDVLGQMDGWKYLPLGAVIGKVEIVACRRTDDHYFDIHPFTYQERAFGDWSKGRYAWQAISPVLFDEPIPAKGSQGIWRWSREILQVQT
ncbi:ASCH domain-containing protein [Christensenellaceae bacterium OttesenSCG-928-K19]|nr:ASCH domain-containing protein [Christensenellaceae bacterium OttesenSCG-928-K19]